MNKRILSIVLSIFIGVQSQAQFSIKKDWQSLGTIMIAGISDGTNEELSHHYNNFKKVFPKANDQYWDPKISWTNKYKNGDPTQGPKHFGSTTFLVWTTDGYHMTRFVKNTMVVTSIALSVRPKRKFKDFLVRAIAHSVAYHVGFFVSYEVVFGGIKQW